LDEEIYEFSSVPSGSYKIALSNVAQELTLIEDDGSLVTTSVDEPYPITASLTNPDEHWVETTARRREERKQRARTRRNVQTFVKSVHPLME
jgi:hypothetical protein